MDLFEFLARQDEANRHLDELEPPAEAVEVVSFPERSPAEEQPLGGEPPQTRSTSNPSKTRGVWTERFESPGGRASEQELLEGLNTQQHEAVLHKDGPMLVLAGAGSGKTMVITRRIAHLIQVAGVSPFAILAITFTNKAAREMKERIGELIGPIADRMWVGTFHSMFSRILRRHAELLGYPSQFSIVDADDQLALVRRTMKDLGVSDERFKPRYIQSRISTAKNQMLDVDAFAKSAAGSIDQVIAEVYELYQRRLQESAAMDFDDILLNMVRLLKEHPEVREQWQSRFEYILVDEYQDTNAAQYEAVRLLAKKHKNICVVGDDDQSIYSFRGADLSNILEFEKDYKRCKIIKLEQNYRSTGVILQSANQVIAHNRGRKRKKLWTGSERGEAVTFYRGNDQYDEGRFVADEINRRVRRDKTGLSYRDIAVLYRNNALSRSMEGAFRERGIPYRVFGGMRFYDRREIKDVIAYLRLILMPDDNLSFERVINVPKRGIGTVTVEAIRALSASENVSCLEICRQAHQFSQISRAARKLIAFAEMIDGLAACLSKNELSFEDFLEYVENESGLIQSIIEEQESGKDLTVDRIENLKELLSDAKEFTENYVRESALDDEAFWDTDGSAMAAAALAEEPPTLVELLTAFLEQSALYSEMDLEGQGDDYVRLMTIHSAKGLEFKVVFLIAAEETIFPNRRATDTPEGEEEERRLAYVAITRARDKLYVTTARSRMLYGQTQYLPVSRFVKEIPTETLEEIGGSVQGDAAAYGTARSAGVERREGSERKGYAAGGSFGVVGRSASGTARGSAKERNKGLSYIRQTDKTMRDTAPTSDDRYLKPSQLVDGMLVRHNRFGVGKLLSNEKVAGDAVVVVRFDKGVKKTLLLRQARLTKEKL